MGKIVLDPITRLEGHLKINVTLDYNTVTSVQVVGGLYRDFENMLLNRVPKDAAFLTQRICGLCPISHAIASSKAIEQVANFTPTLQGLLLRNLIEGANYLSDNILHFYHLSLMDYVKGSQISPWVPAYEVDYRLSTADNELLMSNYISALSIRRQAHEMGAIFAGKLPHAASIVPGGVTAIPTANDISKFREYLNNVISFIESTYQSDVNKLAEIYKDYYDIGKGYGNLITYGVFDTDISGGLLFPGGIVTNGDISGVNQQNVEEHVKYSWYSSPSGENPANETTTPSYGKEDAYTWLKAPRYNGQPFEAGSIARAWVSGDYREGVSVMDRHIAKQIETLKVAKNMLIWLDQLVVGQTGYTNIGTPTSGSGVGLTEAPRGALGHWISIDNSTISKYQIVTPTCWNASPKDDNENYGPIEKALIGTFVTDVDKPIELLRIVHSFDPCTGCSVHVLSPEGVEMSKFIVQPIGV